MKVDRFLFNVIKDGGCKRSSTAQVIILTICVNKCFKNIPYRVSKMKLLNGKKYYLYQTQKIKSLLCSISVFFKKYVFLHYDTCQPPRCIFWPLDFFFLFVEVHFHISMSYFFEKFLTKKCCSTIDQDFIYTFLSPLKIKTKVK